MSKQLTPIQSAIDTIKNEYAEVCSRESILCVLESLLPEEKQFAKESFQAGIEYFDEMRDDPRKAVTFSKYYKKYEDENKDKA